ncbi:MAG: HAD family phosphatase [Nostoc sp. DedSLP03]|uniref:HAD family hydrolase n=1 Tax=Nostoc sp. DedSLP03 TaxID=3075400 RepID=UPI002AD24746|nr:HAD family phosphatase [Nostoc sp. DedSLP03]MDZ7963480.1 HAD family phosphatase [Nostoc sp. DedSLP03]
MDAVLFDMDGTLLDSEPLSDIFLIKFCREIGFELTENILDKFRGSDARTFWTYLSKEFNLSQSIEEYVLRETLDFVEELKNNSNLAPIEGVKELIDELFDFGVPLALASSAPRIRVNTVLECFNMQNKFSVKISGQDVERGKPEPDIFLLASERMNVNPNKCVVIEDSENGIKAAKKAGMKCVGFAGLKHNKQNLSSADLIVSAYSDVNFYSLQQLFD